MAYTEDLKSSEETHESSSLSSGTKLLELILKGPFEGKRLVVIKPICPRCGNEKELKELLVESKIEGETGYFWFCVTVGCPLGPTIIKSFKPLGEK